MEVELKELSEEEAEDDKAYLASVSSALLDAISSAKTTRILLAGCFPEYNVCPCTIRHENVRQKYWHIMCLHYSIKSPPKNSDETLTT